MGVTSSSSLSAAQEVKIYRQLKAENASLRIANPSITDAELYQALQGKHSSLVEAYCQESHGNGNTLCPKVRFGRTELQMPILTCGGMRMQQTWAPAEGTTLESINKECQANFEQIVDHCMKVGINHFETARGYGTSELQYGPILKKYSRSSYILQTKVVPKENVAEFRSMLERSFLSLQLDNDHPDSYVDLFSFHGVNRLEQLVWITRPGGCLEVIREYQSQGKIRYVGFSTHGMTSIIVEAIETGVFDYVNLHYQFVGSYTASGCNSRGGNIAAIEAAQRQDMGVFIISPSDKGGALYEPSVTFNSVCQPISPIVFNNLWLWASEVPIHTVVIGAARPADIDEHMQSARLYEQRKEISAPIAERMYRLVDNTLGPDFRVIWSDGLLDAYSNPEGVGFGYLYWLWWIVKCWGMYKFATLRYQSLEGNLKDWKDDAPLEENLKFFGWAPGLSYRPEREAQIRAILSSHPRGDEVLSAIKEVHQWLHSGGCLLRGETPQNISDHSGWLSAYNLQPDVPFPERK